MPVISILCVYEVDGLEAGSEDYKLRLRIDQNRAIAKMQKVNRKVKTDQVDQDGRALFKLDLDIVFHNLATWKYYKQRSNYLKLYKGFNSKIKEIYGPEWTVVKQAFVPNFGEEFDPEDVSPICHFYLRLKDLFV